jgi:hypothetical protein
MVEHRAPSALGARIWERYVSPDTPGSLASRARAKRWSECAERFPDLARMRVIDLGGYVRNWDAAPVRPRELTVVNLDRAGTAGGADGARTLFADACDLPPELFGHGFDLVYSNSLIEHLGGRWRRQAFARAVARLAPHCWIQTPSSTFPIEPHWMFPGFQFLPISTRVRISKRWRFGSEPMTDWPHARLVDACLSVELVSATEMRDLFPDAELVHERVLGMSKSLIAVR